MPVAKLGLTFEFGLKAVNLIFETLAIGIFIFKAPFSRFFRCTIPFAYFFFYQYGVISRPYSLMMLGFVISALMYKERNEKPFIFSTALALICSASAFGIVITDGIAATWIRESFGKSISLGSVKEVVKTKKCYAILNLFTYNIILLILIFPFQDTYAVTIDNGSIAANLLYMFFVAPADAICSYGYFSSNIQVYLSIVISCLINFMILVVAGIFKKRGCLFGRLLYLQYLVELFILTSSLGYHCNVLHVFFMVLL